MFDMRRREFITLFGGAAALPSLLLSLAARAQQPAMPVIGFLSGASPDLYSNRLRTFRQGLKEAGYVEGQNVEIEYRWAEGENDRLPTLAAQLVNRQVTVIVAAGGTPSALAAKAATTTIPIVFGVAVDPAEVGLVASLNRPGGNLTGVANLNAEVGPKRLELLHELLPRATIIAVLVDPTTCSCLPTLRERRYRRLNRFKRFRCAGPCDQRLAVCQFVVRDAAFRMGDQRAISAFTRRAKLTGVLSCLAGIDPPSSASRFLTKGSSSALSNAAASLAMISLGVPLGAKMPAQMLI
jgi:ABC transporter substrate binding protein